MATVIKTWVFLADAEGLADEGLSAAIAFAFVGADGNPPGCVGFTTTTDNLVAVTEKARRAATGQTWEDWGVPAGSTVTSVQITGWDSKTQTLNVGCSGTFSARVVDSGGVSVTAGGDLIDLSVIPASGTGWGARTPGGAQAVNANRQPSATDVRLELQVILTTNFAGSSIDYRLDNIALTIVYTPGGGGGGNTVADIVRHSPHYSDSANAQRSIVRHG